MTDPRVPADKQEEAQLPDDLDQNPDQSRGLFGQHGSEDAQLLAEAQAGAGKVETDATTADVAPPVDDEPTND